MKILIIEDELAASRRLMNMILEIEPSAIFNGPIRTISELKTTLLEGEKYDIIFSDIQLADGNSIDVFQQIPVSAPIVFTTAFDEFAVTAFKLNSIHYLLKPIEKEGLAEAFDKYKNRLLVLPDLSILLQSLPKEKSYKQRFLFKLGQRMIPMEATEISAFLAEDKMVFAISNDGAKYPADYTLDSLEDRMNPTDFFRLNRGCLANRKAIEKVTSHYTGKLMVKLQVSEVPEITVSKEKASAFKSWLS